jgi:magnesium-transporting ATPase (P-type)
MLYPGAPFRPPDVVVASPIPADDYRYFRLSSFGIPLLIIILAIFTTVICLTAWQSRSDIRQLKAGIPMDVEVPTTSRSREGGVPLFKRALRLTICVCGIFLAAVALLVFAVGLKPVLRSRINFVLAVLLILAGILAVITFAFDMNSERDAEKCTTNPNYTRVCRSREDMSTGFTLWDAIMAIFFFISGFCILAYSRSGDWTRAREKDLQFAGGAAVMPGLVPNGISFVRKSITLIAIFVLLSISIINLVFTIYVHDLRERVLLVDKFNRPTFEQGAFTNPGWPIKNSKLRYATCSLVILTVLFNLIPLNSRIIGYVLGWFYLIYAVMAFVCFAVDIDAIEHSKKVVCPDQFTCKHHPYAATTAVEFVGGIFLLIFVALEYFVFGRKKKPVPPQEFI